MNPGGMQVQIVDPSAFTPPYDHSLCAALARAGADVELVTSRFLYGPVPSGDGYRVNELFYRRTARRGLQAPGRRALKLAEHVPDMLRYRGHARQADLVHYQWLSVEPLDALLLPPKRPRVLTAHNVLSHEPRPGQATARRRLLRAMDAVMVALRPRRRAGGGRRRGPGARARDPARRLRLPHAPAGRAAAAARARGGGGAGGAVLRPDPPLQGSGRPAARVQAGRGRASCGWWACRVWTWRRCARWPASACASSSASSATPRSPPTSGAPTSWCCPYRDIDQSGVLYSALAFGRPLVLSAAGGFVELAESHGAARLVPPGDERALAEAITELLADPAARAELAAAAARAAAGPYSWDEVAAPHPRGVPAAARPIIDRWESSRSSSGCRRACSSTRTPATRCSCGWPRAARAPASAAGRPRPLRPACR